MTMTLEATTTHAENAQVRKVRASMFANRARMMGSRVAEAFETLHTRRVSDAYEARYQLRLAREAAGHCKRCGDPHVYDKRSGYCSQCFSDWIN